MSKIKCEICGGEEHVIQTHLKKDHPEWTLEQYQAKYPNSPIMSEQAKQLLAQRAAERAKVAEGAGASAAMATVADGAAVSKLVPREVVLKRPFHEVFELGSVPAAMNAMGKPIAMSVLAPHNHQELVPAISTNYVYDIEQLKHVMLALELRLPTYIYGHKGTGKSELLEQVAARTNRPMARVQHSANTEESHIVGQWTVKGGETVFELGPLPLAMMHGWVYCADEYDFGMPSVLAVYQAVLEGKPLYIKEAPADLRVIKPHDNFRFVATGNTNGAGDETGLYQGTLIQNSANYDRFGVMIHKKYMPPEAESLILQNHCKLQKPDADKMVKFANEIRTAFDGAKMSDTISPRSLINASKLGVLRGSFTLGLELSFMAKLTRVDSEVAKGVAQRIFGGK
ncbi:AAA family ATPase [Herbaspirillum huttiense]|uniref:AAA family ATPase n=1 Tax=Herbaspirillum huttiense subsp. lycopersici TaxID=3074428 RepID=A0ABU2EG56_9BURK|nr:AAA family ATPase [Herbaspirillum huttiense]MDR9847127.1 AAA family ATPase [Herbaspirillum huttiense SE1]